MNLTKVTLLTITRLYDFNIGLPLSATSRIISIVVELLTLEQ